MSDDIRRWSDALAANPASRVFLPLGDALRRRGQLDPALKVATRGLERHPYDADAHDLLARIWVDRGEPERARDEWSAALRCAPDHAGALKGSGFLSFTEGKLAEAEDYLGRAARADTEDASIRAALARVRTMRGRPPEPDEISPTTVALDPRGPSPAPAGAIHLSNPRDLFADIVSSGEQAALLLDADGLVLAGAYAAADGHDVGAEVGAALTGVSDEAQRAMRHLSLGDWSTITVETEVAVVAVAPMPDDGLALVAAARSVPQGLVRRTLGRVSERGGRWLASWDGGEP